MNDFSFQWHITDRCYGRCRHCYQSAFDGGTELPLDDLKRIAGSVMSAIDAPISINVTGGEPLFYQCHDKDRNSGKDNGNSVFELMAYLSTYDNLDELSIITSTWGMDSSTVNNLLALPKLTGVKVSLESHDPLVNDRIRGDGYFDMAARNIEILSRARIPVTVMATLGRHNYRSAEGLCELAAGLGARGVILERYVPLGRGLEMSDSVLTSREWRELLRAVCRIAGMDTGADDGDAAIATLLPYRAFWIDMPRGLTGDACEVSGALCQLGPSFMALMPDGTVYPCRRAPTPVGKLPEDGMARVLESLEGYSSSSQKCFDFDF